MTLSQPDPASRLRTERRYLRAPQPIFFPVEEKVPESTWHFEGRVDLYRSLQRELSGGALLASDQFVYWDPTDPKKSLAPDLALRTGSSNDPILSWKTWERGAPHVGVEIVSDSDDSDRDFAAKLERYRQAGIREVVRFDGADAARPLRLWDLVDGDLVERDLTGPESRLCDALGLYWCVRNDPRLGRMLRVSRDPAGLDLVLTPVEIERAAVEIERAAKESERVAKESERAAKESERAAKESERAAKESERAAKEAALARVAELEAELGRRGR